MAPTPHDRCPVCGAWINGTTHTRSVTECRLMDAVEALLEIQTAAVQRLEAAGMTGVRERFGHAREQLAKARAEVLREAS